MIILTLRTDKPIAEIGIYDGSTKIAYRTWEAHRQLAESIHNKLKEVLVLQKLQWSSIEGIVCYQGPGSFTGLRIGLSVANALAMSNNAPIVATTNEQWTEDGIEMLLAGSSNKVVVPEYGQPVRITQQRK
jgi:tRNA threonylcarbamoyladenosine biosynthesis protein TsaB